jgi:hypothetical protein
LHKPTGVQINTSTSSQNRQEMFKEISRSNLTPMERMLAEQQQGQLKLNADDAKKYRAALDQGTKNYEAGVKNGSIKPKTGWLPRQIEKLEGKAATDPRGLTAMYISEIPKVLFVVLPLLALGLKVLYWRQRRTFVEHLVFLLHFHSFAFLILLPIGWVTSGFTNVALALVVGIWIPAYVFIAMRKFYKQPWWLTLLKSWILGFTYVVLSAAGALLALFIVLASLDDSQTSPQQQIAGRAIISATQ